MMYSRLLDLVNNFNGGGLIFRPFFAIFWPFFSNLICFNHSSSYNKVKGGENFQFFFIIVPTQKRTPLTIKDREKLIEESLEPGF